MPDGEILYLLADARTGIPDPDVTRFMCMQLRQTGASSGTIKRVLDGVRIGLDFLDERGIDLEARIGEARFLSMDELSALVLRFRNRRDGSGSVVPPLAAHRLASFRSYVAYLTDEVVVHAGTEQRKDVLRSLNRFQDTALKVSPQRRSAAPPNEKLGLETAQRELLTRVIRPDDPGNPFRPKLRVRNHAMILLAYTMGFRAGEEFGLKGKDYVTREHPAMVTVHRRPNDPDETRSEPALAKTLSRTLHVDGETRRAMDAWIKDRQDRAKYPHARKHPYIFVATNGSKITLRGARAVYARLRSVYPELAGVGQHVLRHDANDRWIEHNEHKNLDPMSARQDQCYAMGWTSTSSQPENYAKAAIRRRTNTRLADMQRKMTEPKKG